MIWKPIRNYFSCNFIDSVQYVVVVDEYIRLSLGPEWLHDFPLFRNVLGSVRNYVR